MGRNSNIEDKVSDSNLRRLESIFFIGNTYQGTRMSNINTSTQTVIRHQEMFQIHMVLLDKQQIHPVDTQYKKK